MKIVWQWETRTEYCKKFHSACLRFKITKWNAKLGTAYAGMEMRDGNYHVILQFETIKDAVRFARFMTKNYPEKKELAVNASTGIK